MDGKGWDGKERPGMSLRCDTLNEHGSAQEKEQEPFIARRKALRTHISLYSHKSYDFHSTFNLARVAVSGVTFVPMVATFVKATSHLPQSSCVSSPLFLTPLHSACGS